MDDTGGDGDGEAVGRADADGPYEACTLSVSVRRPPAAVAAFVGDPRTLPRWSFVDSVEQAGDGWRATTPAGTATFRFAPPNDLGVLDHDVEVAPGDVVHVPMRVVPNGAGSEVLFTLLRRPGTSHAEFAEDVRTVTRDLAALRAVLEDGGADASA